MDGGIASKSICNSDDEQKAWLDQQAALRRVSTAVLVRQAVSEFRMREQRGSAAAFQEVLERTAGIWQAGDGFAYQERIRKEWP